MRRGRWLVLAVAGALVAAPDVGARQGLTADDLFDNSVLHDVHLFVNSRDFALLQERYRSNDYYPADLEWRGLRVRNVAIRSRGHGSRDRRKPGLRVDFNKFTTGQRYLGLDSLILDNLYQDPSMIQENVAMSMFRRVGQIAPRESFCRLFINNTFWGLYGIVESVDDGFVTRNLGETGGYLHEYNNLYPYVMQDLGDDLRAYAELFDAQNHELESDSALYGPIRDLIKEINGPDDAVWFDRVNARIDITQFMNHVGVQSFLGQGDGILGSWGINNFYLYRFANSTRHRLLTWDEDMAFEWPSANLLRHYDQAFPVLFERAYNRRDLNLKEIFLGMVEQCARSAADGDWLAKEIDRLAGLVGPTVRADPNKPSFIDDDFDRRIEKLQRFAERQPEFALGDVARLRALQ